MQKCKETLDFYNLIWKVVGYLDKEKYDLIWDIFVLKKSQKRIAIEKGISESAVSQLKDTAIKDLILHFNFDKDFKQTDFYKKYIQKEARDFVRILKELTPEDIGYYIMNGSLDFSKLLTQIVKKITIHGIELDYKDIISKINRVVKSALEELTANTDEQSNNNIIKILNIPKTIFNKENVNLIANRLLKFLK